jgi:hypothetical protein
MVGVRGWCWSQDGDCCRAGVGVFGVLVSRVDNDGG